MASDKETRQPIVQLTIEEDGRWCTVVLGLGNFWVFEKDVPNAVLRLRQTANLLEQEVAKRMGTESYVEAIQAQTAESRARYEANIKVRGPEVTQQYRSELRELAGLFGEAAEFGEAVAARKTSAKKEPTNETTAERRARLRRSR